MWQYPLLLSDPVLSGNLFQRLTFMFSIFLLYPQSQTEGMMIYIFVVQLDPFAEFGTVSAMVSQAVPIMNYTGLLE